MKTGRERKREGKRRKSIRKGLKEEEEEKIRMKRWKIGKINTNL